MKKVGIVTLIGYHNYGNRLQNFALKYVIENIMKYKVSSLVLEDQPGFFRMSKKEAILKTLKYGTFSDIVSKSVSILKKNSTKEAAQKTISDTKAIKSQNIREEKFRDFTKEYLNELKFLPEMEEEFMTFVVGSDQVWNPHNLINKPQFFLNFTSNEKKIAYAASFGVSKLSPAISEAYKNNISTFKNISVRENEGSKIVEDLIGVKPAVTLDPTLLLNSEEWSQISKRAKNRPNKPYILTYFLGSLTEEQKNVIRVAKDYYEYDVINLGKVSESQTYETGPSEFIDYIANCEFLLTDSFHGSVFALIFERPFIVYNRKDKVGNHDMSSRIDTLLKTFELSDRKDKRVSSIDDILNVDYTNSKIKLEQEKEKSLNYLRNSLEY